MGKASIPVCMLLADGPGVYEHWVPLKRSKKHPTVATTGDVCLHVIVTEA